MNRHAFQEALDIRIVRQDVGGDIYFYVETPTRDRIFTFPSSRRLFEVIDHGSLIFRLEVSGEDPEEQVIRDYLQVESA